MSASVAGDQSKADRDDTDTAAALIAGDTTKPDDPKTPHDSAGAQDAAPPSAAMSASIAGDRPQADEDDTDTTADLIADDTAKSDDPKASAARSARNDAAGAYALGDAVMVIRTGTLSRSREGIVRFVGATRFAPRARSWSVAL